MQGKIELTNHSDNIKGASISALAPMTKRQLSLYRGLESLVLDQSHIANRPASAPGHFERRVRARMWPDFLEYTRHDENTGNTVLKPPLDSMRDHESV